MRIYGAGLAGLLAAVMLRRHKPLVCEAQASLPNNHDALLRFRSDAVSRVTGIPFKKVWVQKAISCGGRLYTEGNLRFSNMYSRKATGQILNRSINDLRPVERYIAPLDFIKQLADGLDIRYSTPLLGIEQSGIEPIISTIPMPLLMKIVDWEGAGEFAYQTISTITCGIVYPTTEVYQTLYYPGDEEPYRASITGKRVIIEMPGDWEVRLRSNSIVDSIIQRTLEDFGVKFAHATCWDINTKVQKFGKITPVREDLRKEFILAMSDQYNLYSLGRYATWRNILLDDVVNDVQIVESFISQRDNYHRKLKEGI